MTRTRPALTQSPLAPTLRLSLRLAIFALAAAVAACDSGTQEPEAPDAAADAAATAESAPAEASEGGAAAPPVAREGEIDSARLIQELPEGVTAAVPENFPSDVPVYPGSQPAQGKGFDRDGAANAAVQLLTNDALPDVHRYYAEQMRAQGWTIDEENQNDAVGLLRASKGDCKADILIQPAAGGGSDIYVVTGC